MELQTRPLTFDEMYFKKPIVVQLAPPLVIPSAENAITAPTVNIPALPAPPTPAIDLSGEVFPTPPISEKTPNFFIKHWPWILAGVAVAAVAGVVIYKKKQEKEAANSSGN